MSPVTWPFRDPMPARAAEQPLAPAVWGPGEYLPSNRLPGTEWISWRPSTFPGRGKVTATLMKYVLVLDVRRSESSAGKRVLLMALNPNEAQYVALASDSGKIRIILRGEGDMEDHPMELASLSRLFR